MNPWEAILTVLGWFLLVLVLLIIWTILAAVLIGVFKGIVRWFPRRKPKLDEATYMENAEINGRLLYASEIIMPGALAEAFKQGARWGFHQR